MRENSEWGKVRRLPPYRRRVVEAFLSSPYVQCVQFCACSRARGWLPFFPPVHRANFEVSFSDDGGVGVGGDFISMSLCIKSNNNIRRSRPVEKAKEVVGLWYRKPQHAAG